MGDEPPKYGRMDMFHLDRLRSICARAKNPTDLVEGKSLDEHAHYTRHRLSQKGKHLWDQIHVSYCHAEFLCHIYGFTCCSNIDHKHLLSNVSLMKMRSYLLMLKVFKITLMLKRLKSLLLLKVLMRLLLSLKNIMILFTSLKTLQFLLIASRIMFAMIILRILKTKCLLPK